MLRRNRFALLFSTALVAASASTAFALTPAPSAIQSSASSSKVWSSGTGRTISDPNYNPGQSLAPLVKSVRGAVVSVVGKRPTSARNRSTPWFMPPGQGPQGLAQGSGFIVHPDGWVITNHHVIDGQKELEVSLWDGQSYTAKIVGSDPQTDVALLKIQPPKGKKTPFPFVQLGSSDKLDVGDWVVAIGNPMGLHHSVTRGIVSAKSRGDLGLYQQGYADFLQTDAAISPGNSGGPLFNLRGEVIAINTAINRAGNDLGFAVPIDQAKPIIDQLRAHGEVRRGWLGISGSMVTKVKRGRTGALVADVLPGGPADKQGLKAKDRILSINGTTVQDFKDLRLRVASMRPGQSLKLKIQRGGKVIQKKITLARQPTADELARNARRDELRGPRERLFGPGKPRLGVRVQPSKKGMRIEEVADPRGIAAELGLARGDVILRVNGQKITDVQSLRAALAKSNTSVSVTYKRGGVVNKSRLKIQ